MRTDKEPGKTIKEPHCHIILAVASETTLICFIYRYFDHTHPCVKWLWEILEELPEIDKVNFMTFISGRSRLPANPALDLSQRFQILRLDTPLNGLPTAQTCFFQLRLPPYSDKAIMADRLKYAIRHCRTIDMDNYMLQNNEQQNQVVHGMEDIEQ